MESQTKFTRTAEPLRVHRTAARLTQEELSAASGVSRETISNVERGLYVPEVRTQRALAATLRVEPSDLFGVAGDDG